MTNSKNTVPREWDAIVVGSGMGGLTVAGLLSLVAEQRVLVLERHSERGGLTHVFRRDGASWDVGLHYVGDLEPGTQARGLFDLLSGGELTWSRMPDVFERFCFPGLEVVEPSDERRYLASLIAAFPDEERGLRADFRDVRRAARWATLRVVESMVPPPAGALLRGWRRVTRRLPTRTTRDAVATRIRSPKLRRVLTSQWGDYGLVPAESAFALHALVTSFYLRGGWFPDGGASRIARTFEPGIESAGGGILTNHEATGIVIEGGRAVGVRGVDRRGGEPIPFEYRAPLVISGAGAAATFTRLLPTGGPIGERTAEARRRLSTGPRGTSAVTVYVRLRESAETLGVRGENYWIHRAFDDPHPEADARAVMRGAPNAVYLSFPSLKSGDDRFHTAELIAMVPPEPFAAWRGTSTRTRGADYDALKATIADGMLDLVETRLPGFRALVSYREVATPLTYEHYSAHPDGRFYAAPGTPEQYRRAPFGPRTPVPGLLLTGSDAGTLGIEGALFGGLAAACTALGASGYPRITAAVRAGATTTPTPNTDPAPWSERSTAVLTARDRLAPNVWRLEFEVGRPMHVAPGQYVRLRVAPFEWRDYSVAASDGTSLTLLVSTATGGDGSRFADSAPVGTRTHIEGPLGAFRLAPTGRRHCFIATGTGLAPMLPMFAELAARGELGDATLLFGCRDHADDLTRHLDVLPNTVIVCRSRASVAATDPAATDPASNDPASNDPASNDAPSSDVPDAGATIRRSTTAGRVTDALASRAIDADGTDYYVCGSAAMVLDATQLLTARGARHILTEPY